MELAHYRSQLIKLLLSLLLLLADFQCLVVAYVACGILRHVSSAYVHEGRCNHSSFPAPRQARTEESRPSVVPILPLHTTPR